MDKHVNKGILGGPLWELEDQERPRKMGIVIDNNSNNSSSNNNKNNSNNNNNTTKERP
jgi:hypothetical protein